MKTTQKKQQNVNVKRSEIEPLLHIVKHTDDKLHIAYGTYFVSNNTFNTFEEAEKYISSKPLELILCTIAAYLDYKKKEETKE